MTTTIRILIVLSILLAGHPLPAQQASFQVIVNASNGAASLSRTQASRMFLKKETRWPGGSVVHPVDQAHDRAIRRSFSTAVYGKSVSAIKSYWQRQIFSGRGTPPPELPTDRDVLAFVRNDSGAIGYVSAGTPLGDGVKALRITG